MPAGEKRKIWDGCVVPVPLSCQADKAHGRMRTVPCKCDDVTTSSQSIIEPQVAVGVHLERGFRFLTERGFIPQAVSLLLYGRITQTLQIVRNFDLFCFLDVHDIISMDLMMTVKTLI